MPLMNLPNISPINFTYDINPSLPSIFDTHPFIFSYTSPILDAKLSNFVLIPAILVVKPSVNASVIFLTKSIIDMMPSLTVVKTEADILFLSSSEILNESGTNLL